MTITEALRIVLELARENICDAREFPEFAAEQKEACDLVESLQFSDESSNSNG